MAYFLSGEWLSELMGTEEDVCTCISLQAVEKQIPEPPGLREKVLALLVIEGRRRRNHEAYCPVAEYRFLRIQCADALEAYYQEFEATRKPPAPHPPAADPQPSSKPSRRPHRK